MGGDSGGEKFFGHYLGGCLAFLFVPGSIFLEAKGNSGGLRILKEKELFCEILLVYSFLEAGRQGVIISSREQEIILITSG